MIGMKGVLRPDNAVVIEKKVYRPLSVQYADVILREPTWVFPAGDGQMRGLVVSDGDRQLVCSVQLPSREVEVHTSCARGGALAAKMAAYEARRKAEEARGQWARILPVRSGPDLFETSPRSMDAGDSAIEDIF